MLEVKTRRTEELVHREGKMAYIIDLAEQQ